MGAGTERERVSSTRCVGLAEGGDEPYKLVLSSVPLKDYSLKEGQMLSISIGGASDKKRSKQKQGSAG